VDTEPKDTRTALQVAEDKRAARKAALQAKRDEQRVIDLAAIDDLETEHGDNAVKVINVPYRDGMPTCVVARCAKPSELKRYRDRVKPKKSDQGHPPDYVSAGEEVADLCVVYPPAETYARMRESYPGVHLQAGLAAVELAGGREADEGKS